MSQKGRQFRTVPNDNMEGTVRKLASDNVGFTDQVSERVDGSRRG